MRVYISHPIAGMTEEQKALSEKRGAFYVEQFMGGDAVLPRQIPPFCGGHTDGERETECTIRGKWIPGDSHSVQCYMRGDIAELLQCDAMLVMPGWQASSGCRDEINVAAMCGIPIHFFEGGL